MAVYIQKIIIVHFLYNYPNNTDNNYNIIPQLYEVNKNIENDFCINFEGTLEIENNLFGYVYKGVQIMDFPNNIYLKKNDIIIEKNSLLLKDECISLFFNKRQIYEVMNYSIEYAFVLTEPDYENMNNYANYTDVSYGNKVNEKKEYNLYDYIGKSPIFTIMINENLITQCLNNEYSLCYKTDISN